MTSIHETQRRLDELNSSQEIVEKTANIFLSLSDKEFMEHFLIYDKYCRVNASDGNHKKVLSLFYVANHIMSSQLKSDSHIIYSNVFLPPIAYSVKQLEPNLQESSCSKLLEVLQHWISIKIYTEKELGECLELLLKRLEICKKETNKKELSLKEIHNYSKVDFGKLAQISELQKIVDKEKNLEQKDENLTKLVTAQQEFLKQLANTHFRAILQMRLINETIQKLEKI